MPGLPLRPTLRTLALTAGAALLVAGITIHPNRVLAQDAPTAGAQAPAIVQPTPPPQVPAATPSPLPDAVASGAPLTVPTEAPQGRHHRRSKGGGAQASPVPGESPAAAPTAPAYTTFSGTWEVQLQPGSQTVYSHFIFDPAEGTALSGRWLRPGTAPAIITGELDGDRFRLSGSDSHGSFSMAGYEESSTTMVGLFVAGGVRTPFTASHEQSPGPRKAHSRKHGEAAAVSNPAPGAPAAGQ